MTSAAAPIGLYVHVPFCRTRCRYCDFYKVGENTERQAQFLDALHREIAGTVEYHGRRADTVFFGGGTPSLLAPAELAAVLDHLRSVFDLAADVEITAECNPSDLTPERLEGLRAAGLNRLSIGVQSFCDRELVLLGRRHDADRAAQVMVWARAAGFTNLSLDLMVAIPGQTDASFRRSLERALALEPEHISLYLLEVHGGSEMDRLRRQRPRLFPGEEAERRRFFMMSHRLAAAGFEHYEISNFCRPGRAARHNLKYWRCEPFLGFGPSAHSQMDGRRFRRPANLAAYLLQPLASEEQPSDRDSERIFLGLRLAEGVLEAEAQRASALAPAAWAEKLRRLAPFLSRAEGRLRLSPEGFVLSTAVIGELLGEGLPPARLGAQ